MNKKKMVWLDNAGNVAFHRSENGYLRGVARVAKAGVFDYTLNGKKIKVVRKPEAIFKRESMDSLKMIPVTFRHPYKNDPNVVLLDSETTKKFTVGFSGEDVQADGIFATAPLCIYDAGSIGYIDNGVNELSCGYTASLTMEAGVYEGEQYDAIQDDFRYNHIAIEEKGRSGPEVSIVVMDCTDSVINQKKECTKMELEINGVKGEVSPELAASYAAEKKANGEKISSLQAVCDAANAEIVTLKSIDINAKVTEGIKEKLKTVAGVKVCMDCDETELLNLPIDEMKRKAVVAKFPTIALDGKDCAYISALFDVAVQTASKEKENTELNNKKATFNDSGDGTNKSPRELYIQRLQEAHKAK